MKCTKQYSILYNTEYRVYKYTIVDNTRLSHMYGTFESIEYVISSIKEKGIDKLKKEYKTRLRNYPSNYIKIAEFDEVQYIYNDYPELLI